MGYVRASIVLLFSSVLLLVTSCGGSTSPEEEVSFDRSGMLSNYGKNIILPSFRQLQESVIQVESEARNFVDTPTLDQLDTLQAAVKAARLAWQKASPFQFGPAEAVLLRASLNTYPVDTSKVNEYIATGAYSLGSIDSRDAAGFPTLGYLLHGLENSDDEILEMYTVDGQAAKRRDYLLENVLFIKELVTTATSEWQANGGNYIGMFLSEENSGTDVGSSLGMMINSLVLHYERFLRDGKIGIPSGVRSAGVPRPTATEGLYGGYSTELAVANLNQVKHLFSGGSGLGLDDNLTALGAGSLSEEIMREIEEAQAALGQLDDPLSQQINEDIEPVLTVFEEMQDVVVLLKADMTSILGVIITYQDNDGD